jgi:hypothetical protein
MKEYLREYEKKVLAGMVKYPDLRIGWSNILSEDCFLNHDYMLMYKVIQENKQLEEFDLVTEIRANGIRFNYEGEKFVEFVDDDGVGCYNTNSIDKIMQFKRYRDIEKKWKTIDPFNPTEESIQTLFTDVIKAPDGMDYITAHDCFDIIGTEMYSNDESLLPKFSGVKEYDEIIGGFTEGMHVISGRPGAGKSSLASQVLMEYAKTNTNKIAVFFSVEMGKKAIARRTTSYVSRIDNKKIKHHSFSKIDSQRFVHCANKAPKNCIFIPCVGISTNDAMQMLNTIVTEHKKEIGLVCFDYLQKMTPNDKTVSENNEIRNISGDLTEFAKSIPTLVVSNLNQPREGKEYTCPTQGEIKGGSIIAYDATSMMMLWKISEDSSDTCSRMLKNRDGNIGDDATWKFDGSIGTFFFKKWGIEKPTKGNSGLNPF